MDGRARRGQRTSSHDRGPSPEQGEAVVEVSGRTGRRVGIISLAVLGPLAAGTAFAVATNFGGSSMTSMRAVTQTNATFTQGPAWVDVPFAQLAVPVGPGGTIRARFSGESTCANTTSAVGLNHCNTRIVLVGPGGGLLELHPQSDSDYRWDNTVDGRASEAHAMERLLRAPTTGTWTLRAQYATTNAATRLTVDDWTFTADAIAP